MLGIVNLIKAIVMVACNNNLMLVGQHMQEFSEPD